MRGSSLPFLALVIFALTLLIILGSTNGSVAHVSLAFQSELPPPAPAKNPNFVPAVQGGRISCGAQQSPVWLQIPSGYVDSDGAEIHCDLAESLSSTSSARSAWDDQGYLIGIYPPPASLLAPLTLVLEIDRARSNAVCAACWGARYYDSASGQWRPLPTVFDENNSRVYATIARVLPPSQYSAFADRAMIALFTQMPTPTPTVTANAQRRSTSTAAPNPPTTPTMMPASNTPTLEPTATHRPTAIPVSNTPMLEPSATHRPTATREQSAVVSAPTQVETAPAISTTSPAPDSANSNSGLFTLVLLFCILVGVGGVIIVLRRSKGAK